LAASDSLVPAGAACGAVAGDMAAGGRVVHDASTVATVRSKTIDPNLRTDTLRADTAYSPYVLITVALRE
jgi:hypothetical protein